MRVKCNECDDSEVFEDFDEAKEEGWKKKGSHWICPDCIEDYEEDEEDEDEDDEDDDDDDDDGFGFGGGLFGGSGRGFGGGSFGGGGAGF